MLELTTISLEQIINNAYQSEAYTMFNVERPSLFKAASKLEAANDDQVTGLMDILNSTKIAPATTSIVEVPSSIDSMDYQNLMDITLLDAYISVASALVMYKANPSGWDITDPKGASSFTKTLTNSRNKVMTQGLSGFLSIQESANQHFTKNTTAGDLHFDFLTKIFAGFAFPPATIKQLDSILSAIVGKLTALSFSYENTSETLDHMISYYYFEKVPGMDLKIPQMRLFYLRVDQKSWKLAIGKSSVTKFDFSMNYIDTKASMNLSQMNRGRDIIQKYITEMTNQSLEDVKKLVQPSAIQS